MKECKSGRITIRKKGGKEYYYLRLNIVDNSCEDSKKKYCVKDMSTGLEVSKRNYQKANALLEKAISSFAEDAAGSKEPLYLHSFCQKWLENKKPSLELTSYEGYRQKIGIITEYFEKKPILLSDLSAEERIRS